MGFTATFALNSDSYDTSMAFRVRILIRCIGSRAVCIEEYSASIFGTKIMMLLRHADHAFSIQQSQP